MNFFRNGDPSHIAVCKMLIEANPDALRHRNNTGATPLLLAIYSRAPSDLIDLLVNKGDRAS
eukprot:92565-Ditylum_brightwellii.AAC.1